jgi:hypothetical protein
MDSTTSSALAIGSMVVSIGGAILMAINHKRIRSNCCGKEVVASLDVENTTPPDGGLKISIPVVNARDHQHPVADGCPKPTNEHV